MSQDKPQSIRELIGLLFPSHPWHGVDIGADAPRKVTTFVEIVPTDTVKYELDKTSGWLKVDRPQKYSNICPTLYGFIPQTYCGQEVGNLCSEKTGRPGIVGDGDPMDICVLCEKTISHGSILVQAIPIGGLRMIDGNEADDKIVAVLEGDGLFGGWKEIGDCPPALIDRLRHYFLTYKQVPGQAPKTEIAAVYGREEAYEAIRRSRLDYDAKFAEARRRLTALRDSLEGA